MAQKIRHTIQWALPVAIGISFLVSALLIVHEASAINPIPTPSPIPGSYGLAAVKQKPPPTTGARITIPANGASFNSSPITVRGIAPKGLLVQVYNNGVMVGAVMSNGTFSLEVSLFAGVNELTAIVYDELDQAGPTSNTVRVTYTDTNFTAFGDLITLTSTYGRRSAATGTELRWPLQLSGGNGPYAFSIDWGDGTKPELKSQALAGEVTIAHTYKKAGIYTVNIRVTDKNGTSAFLQVVAVSSGKVDPTASADKKIEADEPKPQILWIPTAIALAMLAPAYWLGRRSQMVSIRNKMLKERDGIKES